ncbi:MAG TPA: DNRLRE domain-containing protein [Anaerohalosphaeraceae bacterium]|nr:DNRLRE domain-containing protein [Anaerohalosphaeraceae bacterium]HPB91972.1 DNRLRE domain-containing protein [Anaerohalosphaeraceae bacterium]
MERKVLYVLMLLLIGLAGISEALVITTEYGNGADTYIGNDTQVRSTSTAGASATELRSRYNGGGSRFQCTYLRFDLSDVPSETTFVGAFLQLEATYIKSSTGRRLDVYGLVDESLDNWTESALCYQNAPGMLQPASGWDSGDYLLDESKLVWLGFLTTPGTGGGTPTYPMPFSSNTTDLGTLFSKFLASDTNKLVTLVIINSTGTSSINCEDKFASKEHATYAAPALVIPEPATLVLAGLGGLISLRRRG